MSFHRRRSRGALLALCAALAAGLALAGALSSQKGGGIVPAKKATFHHRQGEPPNPMEYVRRD